MLGWAGWGMFGQDGFGREGLGCVVSEIRRLAMVYDVLVSTASLCPSVLKFRFSAVVDAATPRRFQAFSYRTRAKGTWDFSGVFSICTPDPPGR